MSCHVFFAACQADLIEFVVFQRIRIIQLSIIALLQHLNAQQSAFICQLYHRTQATIDYAGTVLCFFIAVNNAEHLLRIIRYKLIQRAIVRERIVIRRFRPTPLLDRFIGIHIKELCFRFAALTFRFKKTVRHKLYSVPAFTFSSFCIVLRKVPAVALWFSFSLLKMNIWEIDHFAHFSHLFSLSYLRTILAPDK